METAITSLAAFDEIRAGIALYKKENASLVFDYEDPNGEKEARSHIYKLRLAKGKVVAIHKETKAEALAVCRAIDDEKNTLIADVEEMIDVHMTPIKAIEDRRQEEIRAKAEAERLEKERIEQERQDAIAKQEAEVAQRLADLKAKEEAAERAERERLAKICEEERRLVREREILEADKRAEVEAKRREAEAKKQAEIDKQEALKRADQEKQEALDRAEREKQEAIEAEREKARKEAEAKAKAEAERIAAEKAEQERLAEIERKRQANERHRKKIEKETWDGLFVILKDDILTDTVAHYIKIGEIPNVTINY